MQIAILLSQIITIVLLMFLCHIFLDKLRDFNEDMKKTNMEIERVLEVGEASSKFIRKYIEDNMDEELKFSVL